MHLMAEHELAARFLETRRPWICLTYENDV